MLLQETPAGEEFRKAVRWGAGGADESTSSLTSLCCQLLKLNQFANFMIKDVGPEWRGSQPRFGNCDS